MQCAGVSLKKTGLAYAAAGTKLERRQELGYLRNPSSWFGKFIEQLGQTRFRHFIG